MSWSSNFYLCWRKRSSVNLDLVCVRLISEAAGQRMEIKTFKTLLPLSSPLHPQQAGRPSTVTPQRHSFIQGKIDSILKSFLHYTCLSGHQIGVKTSYIWAPLQGWFGIMYLGFKGQAAVWWHRKCWRIETESPFKLQEEHVNSIQKNPWIVMWNLKAWLIFSLMNCIKNYHLKLNSG